MSNHAEYDGTMTSCVCAARYLRACSSSRWRVASSWAGSSSSLSSPESPSSSPPSAIDTSASPCPLPTSSSSPSSLKTRTSPEPVSGPSEDDDPSAGGRLPISPDGIGSSSLRFPGAFSGSTGEAPWFCSGTVSFMRLASVGLGTNDPERFGVSMVGVFEWYVFVFNRERLSLVS